MTREEFLKQREIADHIKKKGVKKIPPGEAHGAVLHLFNPTRKRSNRGVATHTNGQRGFTIDEESGEAIPHTRNEILK